MCDQQSLRSAFAYAQFGQNLCQSLEYFMSVKLLTEHQLEFLNLKGGCRGSSESTLVKMSNCWKSHAAAYLLLCSLFFCPEYFGEKEPCWNFFELTNSLICRWLLFFLFFIVLKKFYEMKIIKRENTAH